MSDAFPMFDAAPVRRIVDKVFALLAQYDGKVPGVDTGALWTWMEENAVYVSAKFATKLGLAAWSPGPAEYRTLIKAFPNLSSKAIVDTARDQLDTYPRFAPELQTVSGTAHAKAAVQRLFDERIPAPMPSAPAAPSSFVDIGDFKFVGTDAAPEWRAAPLDGGRFSRHLSLTQDGAWWDASYRPSGPGMWVAGDLLGESRWGGPRAAIEAVTSFLFANSGRSRAEDAPSSSDPRLVDINGFVYDGTLADPRWVRPADPVVSPMLANSMTVTIQQEFKQWRAVQFLGNSHVTGLLGSSVESREAAIDQAVRYMRNQPDVRRTPKLLRSICIDRLGTAWDVVDKVPDVPTAAGKKLVANTLKALGAGDRELGASKVPAGFGMSGLVEVRLKTPRGDYAEHLASDILTALLPAGKVVLYKSPVPGAGATDAAIRANPMPYYEAFAEAALNVSLNRPVVRPAWYAAEDERPATSEPPTPAAAAVRVETATEMQARIVKLLEPAYGDWRAERSASTAKGLVAKALTIAGVDAKALKLGAKSWSTLDRVEVNIKNQPGDWSSPTGRAIGATAALFVALGVRGLSFDLGGSSNSDHDKAIRATPAPHFAAWLALAASAAPREAGSAGASVLSLQTSIKRRLEPEFGAWLDRRTDASRVRAVVEKLCRGVGLNAAALRLRCTLVSGAGGLVEVVVTQRPLDPAGSDALTLVAQTVWALHIRRDIDIQPRLDASEGEAIAANPAPTLVACLARMDATDLASVPVAAGAVAPSLAASVLARAERLLAHARATADTSNRSGVCIHSAYTYVIDDIDRAAGAIEQARSALVRGEKVEIVTTLRRIGERVALAAARSAKLCSGAKRAGRPSEAPPPTPASIPRPSPMTRPPRSAFAVDPIKAQPFAVGTMPPAIFEIVPNLLIGDMGTSNVRPKIGNDTTGGGFEVEAEALVAPVSAFDVLCRRDYARAAKVLHAVRDLHESSSEVTADAAFEAAWAVYAWDRVDHGMTYARMNHEDIEDDRWRKLLDQLGDGEVSAWAPLTGPEQFEWWTAQLLRVFASLREAYVCWLDEVKTEANTGNALFVSRKKALIAKLPSPVALMPWFVPSGVNVHGEAQYAGVSQRPARGEVQRAIEEAADELEAEVMETDEDRDDADAHRYVGKPIPGGAWRFDEAYTAAISKAMKALAARVQGVTFQQNYKGTGSKAAHRQVFVRFPSGAFIDVWLTDGGVSFGGVAERHPARAWSPTAIPYSKRSAEAVARDVVAMLAAWGVSPQGTRPPPPPSNAPTSNSDVESSTSRGDAELSLRGTRAPGGAGDGGDVSAFAQGEPTPAELVATARGSYTIGTGDPTERPERYPSTISYGASISPPTEASPGDGEDDVGELQGADGPDGRPLGAGEVVAFRELVKDQRVVIGPAEYQDGSLHRRPETGRHGHVERVNVDRFRMQTTFGGGRSTTSDVIETRYVVVHTDAGAMVTLHDSSAPIMYRVARPVAYINDLPPSPIWQRQPNEAIMPIHAVEAIRRLLAGIRSHEAASERARKPENKRSELRAAQDNRALIGQMLREVETWRTREPGAAALWRTISDPLEWARAHAEAEIAAHAYAAPQEAVARRAYLNRVPTSWRTRIKAGDVARRFDPTRYGSIGDAVRVEAIEGSDAVLHDGSRVPLFELTPGEGGGSGSMVVGATAKPVGDTDECQSQRITVNGQSVEIVCGAQGKRDVWHNVVYRGVRYGFNGGRWAKGMTPPPDVLKAVREVAAVFR